MAATWDDATATWDDAVAAWDSALDMPANLHSTSVGSTSVTLAWDAVTGATGYELTITGPA